MIPGPFRNLALIGFMGAGKTSAGEVLAARLGWSFLDADREIERETGRTIAAIFEEDGEPAFRSLEERVVGRLLKEPNAVLALGGGSILSPVTRERLREASFTVLLDVSPQTAWRRIEAHAGRSAARRRGAGVRRVVRAPPPALPRRLRRVRRRRGSPGRGGAPGAARAPRSARRAAQARRRAAGGAHRRPGRTARARIADRPARDRSPSGRRGRQDRGRGPPGVDAPGRPRRGARRRGRGASAAARRPTSPGSWRRPTCGASRWISVPTSLTGMVDAGVGGKTAVDLPAGQERRRRVPPAGVGGVRPGDGRDAAAARVVVRVRRGCEDGPSGRRTAVGSRSRVGARPGIAGRPARADPPVRGVQGPDRRRRPGGAGTAGGAQPGALGRARDRGGDRLQGVLARRGGRRRPARRPAGSRRSAPGSTPPSRRRCASCSAAQGLPVVRPKTSARRGHRRDGAATRRPARGASASRSSRTSAGRSGGSTQATSWSRRRSPGRSRSARGDETLRARGERGSARCSAAARRGPTCR